MDAQQRPEAVWSERSAMMRYAEVIEKADGNYSAYVPDLPGCVATAGTVEAIEAEIRDAIRHIDGLKADGRSAATHQHRRIRRGVNAQSQMPGSVASTSVPNRPPRSSPSEGPSSGRARR